MMRRIRTADAPSADQPKTELWQLWVDTGGTFTDCLAQDSLGRMRRFKVLSSGALRGVVRAVEGTQCVHVEQPHGVPDGFLDGAELVLLDRPERARVELSQASGRLFLTSPIEARPGERCELLCGEEAPILAARLATATPSGTPLPPMMMRLATTRATNALLERSGAPTALFITRGFADLVEIGTQQRPELFAREVRKRRPFYSAVYEVDERLEANGGVLESLDEAALSGRAVARAPRAFTTSAVRPISRRSSDCCPGPRRRSLTPIFRR